MMKPRLAMFAVCLVAGCASAPADDPVRDTSVTLLPGETAALGRSTSLRYDTVADSRCPTDVRCVWAGMIAYQLILSSARGLDRFTLHQDAPAATIRGLRVAIGTAAPPPRGASSGVPAPHPVTFTITTETP